jgi:AcrR family transcriptional regulator
MVMAQRSARERLPELVDAAIRVFGRNGFRATQMADIAREMGLSEAALYRYVEGKEGLFGLVVRHALFLEELPDGDLPLASPPLQDTIGQIRELLTPAAVPPVLAGALRQDRAEDPLAELEGIVRELFSLMVLTAPAMDMIERSAREIPELARLFNVDLRRPLLSALTGYLEQRAAGGQLRRPPYPEAAARLVIETIAWFARHRLSDPDGAAIPAAAAEETVVDALLCTFAAGRRGHAPGRDAGAGDRDARPGTPEARRGTRGARS